MKIKKYKAFTLLILLSLIVNFTTLNTFPVLDRDEARYVQSTKQMLETGHYNSIRFQEELRSKKPIGIYWLQAISVSFLSPKEDFLNKKNNQFNNIWKYRIISSLFSLFTSLLMFLIASKIFNRKVGLFSALALQSTLLFSIEAHIAKTDAVLLTFSVVTMLLLLGYYKGIFVKKHDKVFFAFWSTIGLSILVKGPILPLIILSAMFFIIVFKRSTNWILNTNPLTGIIIVFIIVLPWFLSLSATEQSSFINEGLKNDFINKILSVQENHAAFTGAHTVAILILFFPISLFLLPSIFQCIKGIKLKSNFFLIAWIVPNLIAFELVPTKLPHYTLPLYPALSLLIGIYISENKSYGLKRIGNLYIANSLIYLIITACVSYVFYIAIKNYSSLLQTYAYLVFLIFLIFSFGIIINFSLNKTKSFYYQVFLSCFTSIFIFGLLLPQLDKIWISQNIYEIIKDDNINFKSEDIAAMGYNEPSLIFLLGSEINILKGLDKDFFEKKLFKYIIIDEIYKYDLQTILDRSKREYIILSSMKGFNMSKNKWVNTTIFKLKEK